MVNKPTIGSRPGEGVIRLRDTNSTHSLQEDTILQLTREKKDKEIKQAGERGGKALGKVYGNKTEMPSSLLCREQTRWSHPYRTLNGPSTGYPGISFVGGMSVGRKRRPEPGMPGSRYIGTSARRFVGEAPYSARMLGGWVSPLICCILRKCPNGRSCVFMPSRYSPRPCLPRRLLANTLP